MVCGNNEKSMQEKGDYFVLTTNIQSNVGVHHRCLSRQVGRSLIVGENKRFVFVQSWRDEPRKFPGSGCHSFCCISAARNRTFMMLHVPHPISPLLIFFGRTGITCSVIPVPVRDRQCFGKIRFERGGRKPSSYYFRKFPCEKPMNIKDFCSHKSNELYPPYSSV